METLDMKKALQSRVNLYKVYLQNQRCSFIFIRRMN
jgi:hypothetical protein